MECARVVVVFVEVVIIVEVVVVRLIIVGMGEYCVGISGEITGGRFSYAEVNVVDSWGVKLKEQVDCIE